MIDSFKAGLFLAAGVAWFFIISLAGITGFYLLACVFLIGFSVMEVFIVLKKLWIKYGGQK